MEPEPLAQTVQLELLVQPDQRVLLDHKAEPVEQVEPELLARMEQLVPLVLLDPSELLDRSELLDLLVQPARLVLLDLPEL